MSAAGAKTEVLRFTIVDRAGTISFVDDIFLLQPLLAGCAAGARNLNELLASAGSIDRRIREHVLNGLAIFDEHNTPENLTSIHEDLRDIDGEYGPVIRVLDEITRVESARPTRTGFVIFNLKERRIVQGQNVFGDIVRGEAHIHNGVRYSRQTVPYELPGHWNVVP